MHSLEVAQRLIAVRIYFVAPEMVQAAQQRLRIQDRQVCVDHEVGVFRHLDALSAYAQMY